MSSFTFGILMSLLSSVFWAAAVMNFRIARDTKTSLVVNLGKNLVGIIAFSVTLLITGVSFIQPITKTEFLRIAGSGFFGVAIGDLLFMASLYFLGAGLNSIVGSVYTPILITGGILFLGETLTPGLVVGTILVTFAIYLSSISDLKKRPQHLVLGIIIGCLSMAATATGVIIIKPLLTIHSLNWLNLIRLLVGSIILVIWLFVKPGRQRDFDSMKVKAGWINIAIGGLAGSWLAILFWTLSLAALPASLIAVLGQLTLIVIIFFARFFLGEPLTKMKIIASVVAITGVLSATFLQKIITYIGSLT